MSNYPYKPYGFHDDCTDEIKKRCQQCRERIEKRISKLNIGNCEEVSRRITSPIYGEIPIDNIANILIDTCYMQRLKRIGQLSFCDLAFPGAKHTRFEHSLGTYYLACKICENKYFEKKQEEPPERRVEKIAFKISALLHDIGHGPFSHMSEVLYKILRSIFRMSKSADKKNKHNHEKRAKNIILNTSGCLRNILIKIFEKINKNSLSEDQFLRLMSCSIIGEDPTITGTSGEYVDSLGMSLLLNGPVDIDKLDYMVRDAYYTGVPSGGAADVQKICQNIYSERGDDGKRQMIINSKIIPSIFNLFSLRFIAYKSFIYHHISLIAQEMMLRGFVDYFKSEKMNFISRKEIIKYFNYDDKTIISKLREKSEDINKVIFEIENRLLFKRMGCFIPEEGRIEEYEEFQKRRKKEKKWVKEIGVDDEKDILIVFSPQVEFYPKGIENLYISYPGVGGNKRYSELFKTAINLKFKGEVMICCRNDEKIISKVKKFIKKIKENWTYIKD